MLFLSGAGGSRTRRSPRFELGRFAGLRTAPLLSKAPSTGFEPAISCVTGRRALQAAPRGQCILNGPGGTRTHSIPGSKPRWSALCLPGRAQGRSRTRNRLRPPLRGGARAKPLCQLAHLGNQVAPDGVEPSFPGCRPSVVAVGPRGCIVQVESPRVALGFLACGASVVLLDHDPMFVQAEVVGLEPTSGCWPPPVFKTGPSSGRMTSIREAAEAGIEPT